MTSHTFRGSCLCGRVMYQLTSDIKSTSHCHSLMCRKAHGAAFATYGSVLKEAHSFTAGSQLLASYASSAEVTRTFCSVCGSPMLWHSKGGFADWVSFPLATLDTPYTPPKQRHIHIASKAPWFQIEDGWPQSDAS
jgi:hypothetical protein